MRARAFPVAAACLLAITSRGAGQDLEAESLGGLDGLWVLVEDLGDEAQEGGLTVDALQTFLEMRLRQARIPVLSKDESLASERVPYLYLHARAIRTAAGGWTYTLALQVQQQACIKGGVEGEGLLALTGGCSGFPTWSRSGLHLTGQPLPDAVRGDLDELMDELVNDYLTVNP